MAEAEHIDRTAKPGGRCRRRRPGVLAGFIIVALSTVSGCTGSVQLGPQTVAGLAPSGTVDMEQVQVAYLASAGGGSGTLYYQGAAYPFAIAGLGVGGLGASTIDAAGEVYKLGSLTNFAGTTVGPLRLRDRHPERRRSVDAERVRRDHAPEGQTHGADAEFGWRRHGHKDAVGTWEES